MKFKELKVGMYIIEKGSRTYHGLSLEKIVEIIHIKSHYVNPDTQKPGFNCVWYRMNLSTNSINIENQIFTQQTWGPTFGNKKNEMLDGTIFLVKTVFERSLKLVKWA
jgi:hypothetical protein